MESEYLQFLYFVEAVKILPLKITYHVLGYQLSISHILSNEIVRNNVSRWESKAQLIFPNDMDFQESGIWTYALIAELHTNINESI